MEASGSVAPPRLAPVSGVFNQAHGVIKPIACRPSVSSCSAASTPILGSNRPLSAAREHQPLQSSTPRNTWSLSASSSASDLRATPQQRISCSRLLQSGPDAKSADMSSLPPQLDIPCNTFGRVADLSRRFGGSLCSVASVPSKPGQPPAYRHPPPGRNTSAAALSNSEVHLDRLAKQQQTHQWVLGGSEINLNSLNAALPSNLSFGSDNHRHNAIYSCPRMVHHNTPKDDSLSSCSSNRSSWAAAQSSNGSTLTLAADCERRDDTATPIVQQDHFRQSKTSISASGSLGSAGSFGDFDAGTLGTPSPSDSGVAELEALLKEKDSEIVLLRETLEQNEAVIFQVYQEKEKSWERELRKLRTLYEDRMRKAQQQASQAERLLQQQTHQWQAERKQLKQQLDQLKTKNEELRAQLDETSWDLCQKNGELSLVKSQMKEAQVDQNQRCQEVVRLRGQLKEAQDAAQSSQQRLDAVLTQRELEHQLEVDSVNSLRRLAADDGSTEHQLRLHISHLQQILNEQGKQFEAERQIWSEEKSTVIMYQRHLQQQYVQAMKRNQILEETLGILGFTGLPVATSPSSHKKQPLSSPHSICSDPITIDLDVSSNSSNGESQC